MDKNRFYLDAVNSKEALRKLFIEKWNWDFPGIKELYPELSEELKNRVEQIEILAKNSITK